MFSILADLCNFISDNFIQVIIVLALIVFILLAVGAIMEIKRETPEERNERLRKYKEEQKQEEKRKKKLLEQASKNSNYYSTRQNYYSSSNYTSSVPYKRRGKTIEELSNSRPSLDEITKYGAVRRDEYGNIYNAANEKIDKAAVELKRQTEQMKQMEESRKLREERIRNQQKYWGK